MKVQKKSYKEKKRNQYKKGKKEESINHKNNFKETKNKLGNRKKK